MWSTAKTRQKLKEAYDAEFLATIERAEKQVILAKHGRRLLALLDDRPMVPGDMRPAYDHAAQARQILNDAEDDLRDWRPEADDFATPPAGRSPVPDGGGVVSGNGAARGNGVDETRSVAMSAGTAESNGYRMSAALGEDSVTHDDDMAHRSDMSRAHDADDVRSVGMMGAVENNNSYRPTCGVSAGPNGRVDCDRSSQVDA